MANCINHPNHEARRQCFQCKSPICPACQLHRDHHIFCSEACGKACRRAEYRHGLGMQLRKFRRQVDPRIWWRYPPFLREQWARRAMLLVWGLLLVQAAITGAVYLAVQEFRSTSPLVQQPVPVPLPEPVIAQAAHIEPPHWIEEPHQTEIGMRARAAAGGRSAVVLVNGDVKAYVPAGEVAEITLPVTMGPQAWSLHPADQHRKTEQWVWGNSDRAGFSQLPEARGIAFTFDGGWSGAHADEILAVLRSHGIQATFFLTGRFLQKDPETVRHIVSAGHEVANHTWSHPHLTSYAYNLRHETREHIDQMRLQWELLKTEQLFYRITGQSMAPLWRAPYGEINEELEQWARQLGYTHVGWTSHGAPDRSLDTLDWVADPEHVLFVSGEDMAERIVNLASLPEFSGGIVLMHLGGAERPDPVHEHLGRMIQRLDNNGIPSVTVSELLQSQNQSASE